MERIAESIDGIFSVLYILCMTHLRFSRLVLPIVGLICLWPAVSSAAALVLGIVLALALGNPYLQQTKNLTPRLLALSVVGLGAGMDLNVVARVGLEGFVSTVVGITLTLALGMVLGKLLRTERNISLLITVGTAICGGSAIAAVAPTIGAKNHETSVALGTVFLLNALALVIFPFMGHMLDLSQTQFGLWSALAIHDTSSVVGATLQYGQEALSIGTTVKLARALWIVPVTLAIGFVIQKQRIHGEESGNKVKPKRPWFILGFLLMAAVMTWLPDLRPAGHVVELIAKRGLVLTLFLIGSNLVWPTLRSVGLRPLVQGALLWLAVGSLTLGGILLGWL